MKEVRISRSVWEAAKARLDAAAADWDDEEEEPDDEGREPDPNEDKFSGPVGFRVTGRVVIVDDETGEEVRLGDDDGS